MHLLMQRSPAMDQSVSTAAVNAMQQDLVEILRENGIRVKNVPRLRKEIASVLADWNKEVTDLIRIRNELLDRIRDDKNLWERIPE